MQGAGGAVEGREQAVTGRLHLAPAEALELDPRRLEVIREKLSPACVAEAHRDRGRVDEIGEEQRGEDTAANARRETGPGSDPAPLDLHALFVADRVPVVSGRDVEHVPRPELGLRAVGERDSEPTGDDDAEVARLAPLAADGRLHVDRPAPAGLGDQLGDREIAELDDASPMFGNSMTSSGVSRLL